ncbi:MAG: hypothetical protein KAJ86_00135 [Alphaproteobacteria bacterium]|nr:hypothetical protein [Alphaproteobacteria bacterium]
MMELNESPVYTFLYNAYKNYNFTNSTFEEHGFDKMSENFYKELSKIIKYEGESKAIKDLHCGVCHFVRLQRYCVDGEEDIDGKYIDGQFKALAEGLKKTRRLSDEFMKKLYSSFGIETDSGVAEKVSFASLFKSLNDAVCGSDKPVKIISSKPVEYKSVEYKNTSGEFLRSLSAYPSC